MLKSSSIYTASIMCIVDTVPSFDRSSGVRRVCCWAPCGQEIYRSTAGGGRPAAVAPQYEATAIGADFFFLPRAKDKLSPPLFSFLLSLPSFPLPLLYKQAPYIQLGGLGKRCKFPQRGLGRIPSWQKMTRCTLESKSAALVAAVLLIFLRTGVIFCTKTSLISHSGSSSSQGGAPCGVFLLGPSPPLPYGSRAQHGHSAANASGATLAAGVGKLNTDSLFHRCENGFLRFLFGHVFNVF